MPAVHFAAVLLWWRMPVQQCRVLILLLMCCPQASQSKPAKGSLFDDMDASDLFGGKGDKADKEKKDKPKEKEKRTAKDDSLFGPSPSEC